VELPRRGKSKGEEGYGQGRAAIAAGADVLLDEDTLVAELLACLEAPSYRPPTLPAVALEVMSLAQRPDVAIKDVVAVLERDALIAGRVLQVACSAVYRQRAWQSGDPRGSCHFAAYRTSIRPLKVSGHSEAFFRDPATLV
jgi:hypothetical protein